MSAIQISPEGPPSLGEWQAAATEAAQRAAEERAERREQFSRRLGLLVGEVAVEPPLTPLEEMSLVGLCLGNRPQSDEEMDCRFLIVTPELGGRTDRDRALNQLYRLLHAKSPAAC